VSETRPNHSSLNRASTDAPNEGLTMPTESQANFAVSDSKARRAARRLGLVAKKSRWRKGTIDNRGGFLLLDPQTNSVVAGVRFDLTADDVVKIL
jgi:hypothetical protein